MKTIPHTYAFHSNPEELKPNDFLNPPENLHDICFRHNQSIAGKYTDSRRRAQGNYEYFRKAVKSGLSVDEYKILLNKLRIFSKDCMNIKGCVIDHGVEIDNQENTLIKDCYQRLVEYLGGIIPTIKENIEFVQSQIGLSANGLNIQAPSTNGNFTTSSIKRDKWKEDIDSYLIDPDHRRGIYYPFQNEKDYNLFTNLLIDYLEQLPFQHPGTIIQLKKGSKTSFSRKLNDVHKIKKKVLRSDTRFFDVLKVLDEFENETDIKICNSLQK